MFTFLTTFEIFKLVNICILQIMKMEFLTKGYITTYNYGAVVITTFRHPLSTGSIHSEYACCGINRLELKKDFF